MENHQPFLHFKVFLPVFVSVLEKENCKVLMWFQWRERIWPALHVFLLKFLPEQTVLTTPVYCTWTSAFKEQNVEKKCRTVWRQ